jgi:hypothetical protein
VTSFFSAQVRTPLEYQTVRLTTAFSTVNIRQFAPQKRPGRRSFKKFLNEDSTPKLLFFEGWIARFCKDLENFLQDSENVLHPELFDLT